MSFDYLSTKEDADELIAEFGQSATLRRETVTGGTAWDPSGGTVTTTDYPVDVVVTDYSVREIDGTRILATDKKVLMAVGNLTIEPNPETDKLIVGSTTFTLITPVNPLAPGGINVLFVLQCRR